MAERLAAGKERSVAEVPHLFRGPFGSRRPSVESVLGNTCAKCRCAGQSAVCHEEGAEFESGGGLLELLVRLACVS